MTGLHEFNGIVDESRLTREQALRLGPAGTARRLAPVAMRDGISIATTSTFVDRNKTCYYSWQWRWHSSDNRRPFHRGS